MNGMHVCINESLTDHSNSITEGEKMIKKIEDEFLQQRRMEENGEDENYPSHKNLKRTLSLYWVGGYGDMLKSFKIVFITYRISMFSVLTLIII